MYIAKDIIFIKNINSYRYRGRGLSMSDVNTSGIAWDNVAMLNCCDRNVDAANGNPEPSHQTSVASLRQ